MISKHISEREFACSGHGGKLIIHALPHPYLIECFEKIRMAYGKPILVTSGSRCPEFQKYLKEVAKMPSATNSPHVYRTDKDKNVWTFALDGDLPNPKIGGNRHSKEYISECLKINTKMRDFIRNDVGIKDARIGYKAYALAGMTFFHMDVAWLSNFPGKPSSWIPGVEW